MKTLRIGSSLALACGMAAWAFGGDLQIENDTLQMRVDEATGEFSLLTRADGRVVVKRGRLEGVEDGHRAKVVDKSDPIFGAGRALKIPRDDGGAVSLELYPRLSFGVLRQTLRNPTAKHRDLRQVVAATYEVDLGKPAAKLVTMGTGGLLAANENPGSYLFLTAADPATREGIVAGWLTHDRGDGVLFSSVTKAGAIEIKAQVDYGHLRIAPGQDAAIETLLIGHFADARLGQEQLADAIKKQYAIELRPQVNGFCTWYSEVGGLTDPKNGAGACNEKDLVTLADFAVAKLKPFGFSFVQIDDEWQDGATNPDGTRINGPRRGFSRHKPDGPYPSGMAATAKNLRDRGLTAGIWFLPFAGNHQDKDFPKHWFMQRRDGMPYETTWGGTSFDLTHPEVRDYLRNLARTIHGWGYNYFKMDGLWTGSCTEQVYVNDGYTDDSIGNHKPFHNPDTTNIEALRSGLRTLREGAGPDVFFSGCCASQNMRSLGGVIGLVDSMRIGPDNGFEWQDWRNETMHFEGGGIITGPIRANRLYFLHGRVWWNDPDPAYVRPAVALNHAQLLASWIAIAGQFNLNSDWLPKLPAERLDILKRCMPSHQAQARPVDYFDSPMPGIWLVSDTQGSVMRNVLGIYNWDSNAKSIAYGLAKAGLSDGVTYHAFDFWAKRPMAPVRGSFDVSMPKESCKIIALRAVEDHPVVVSTSRHVTQGIIDLTDEVWDGKSLSGISQVVGGDSYELRIAGMKNQGGRPWHQGVATVAADDRNAGVTIEAVPDGDDDWLRLRISSKANRSVKWTVYFSR